MRNQFLDDRSALDIDHRIERIHTDLGSRDRPVELVRVRELLELDLRYYRAGDPDVLGEVVHKFRMGADRVMRAPHLLIEAVAKFGLRALFLSHRKRILIDSELPDAKKRWSEGHEIAHSVIPWHDGYMHGDNRTTLSPGCQERIEAEANYGAGRLLFPARAFGEASLSSPPTMEHIRELADQFGNTITSTLWRYVEGYSGLALGLIGQHPHFPQGDESTVAYLVGSRRFLAEFPHVSEEELATVLRGYCSRRRGGPLGSGQAVLLDANGAPHTFSMNSFGNTHQVLTLGWA
jgi:hypothetical protein